MTVDLDHRQYRAQELKQLDQSSRVDLCGPVGPSLCCHGPPGGLGSTGAHWGGQRVKHEANKHG